MIKAYFDGCMEPKNPGGTGAYGVIVFKNDQEIYRASKMFDPTPNQSNNYAEYAGFLAILEYLLKNEMEQEEIHIYGDSNLVIQQMSGRWKIRQGYYVPLALIARKLVVKFPKLKLQWIPREENNLADELSKAELKKAGVKFRIQKEE